MLSCFGIERSALGVRRFLQMFFNAQHPTFNSERRRKGR
jgi:hypothetical protein